MPSDQENDKIHIPLSQIAVRNLRDRRKERAEDRKRERGRNKERERAGDRKRERAGDIKRENLYHIFIFIVTLMDV